MDVRAQVATLLHLDKCIGCHTCSISCKNLWTDREGAEYMWWNNVETKPGTGYPTLWEDQSRHKGGWERRYKQLRLRSTGKLRGLSNIFFNPSLPTLDDYYEPWSYRYQDLFDAPEDDDQPTARPISMVTGEPIDIQAGPNWDDDLGGSRLYAANDPNLAALTDQERQQLFQLERMAYFYLPRTCNHCLNPACVAACPSGALHKRGEDGLVLVNQDQCRGWRHCVAACPYKKVYYNWSTGKSEKCILCYPRQEVGLAPACLHSCVGRIRFTGVILYDAERIREAASAPVYLLVERLRDLILDPHSPAVLEAARENRIPEGWLDAARTSPVYKMVKQWGIGLPLHSEFRTLPTQFFVPPLLLPMIASAADGVYRLDAQELFARVDQNRVPLRYLASLFAAGKEEMVRAALAKLMAVRAYQRALTVGDLQIPDAERLLEEAGSSPTEAEEIHRLTALATFADRHQVPPYQGELPIQEKTDPQRYRGVSGLGRRLAPQREQ